MADDLPRGATLRDGAYSPKYIAAFHEQKVM